MGYYISGPVRGKAKYLVDEYGAELLPFPPRSYDSIPDDMAAVVVIDNGPFEAAGFAYSEQELKAFSEEDDPRLKSWLLMDRKTAEALTGYGR
jgi:hypothetical protein